MRTKVIGLGAAAILLVGLLAVGAAAWSAAVPATVGRLGLGLVQVMTPVALLLTVVLVVRRRR